MIKDNHSQNKRKTPGDSQTQMWQGFRTKDDHPIRKSDFVDCPIGAAGLNEVSSMYYPNFSGGVKGEVKS